MSQQSSEQKMDRPLASQGSVRRARERALAGAPRGPVPPRRSQMLNEPEEMEFTTTPLRPRPSQSPPQPNSQASVPLPSSRIPPRRNMPAPDRNIGQAVSRPTQVPQWPLPAPLLSPSSPVDGSPYEPPPGRPRQAPQRPPRPSRIPSMVDHARLQEPTPTFLNRQTIPAVTPEQVQEPYHSTPLTPGSSSRHTSSSAGSIPDFPVPMTSNGPVIPPRRSFNLGPPPSSRRGASSFYSNASYVSPIPEESPQARSHGSYASSAAMPDVWGTVSPATSPAYADAFYEESITDKDRDSIYEDFGDESKLVRSASIGKKGKPALIDTKAPVQSQSQATQDRPASPRQPFEEGTAYLDASTSSSNTLPSTKPTPTVTPGTGEDQAMGQGGILGAAALAALPLGNASSAVPAQSVSQSPPPSRLSAMRRPPRLDMDAVRTAEARGSLTSLPDLIRRATKLAAMIDGGKRPASRFEDLSEFLNEKAGGRHKDQEAAGDDRYQSGLSDMLAAFPPPAQTDGPSRGSWFRGTSWPLAPGRQQNRAAAMADGKPGLRRRKCCGIPMWAFILLMILLLCIVAAAIVLPLEFFVFKNLGSHPSSASDQCDTTLTCLNGGTNVVSQGNCSCICTNGFTGSDCSEGGSAACTTTNLISSDGSSSINNVTLGGAIPRIIVGSEANFSVPLSGTVLLSKFNSADLSCIAQNSLVTFQGQSSPVSETSTDVQDISGSANNAALQAEAFVAVSFITIIPTAQTTISLNGVGNGVGMPTMASEVSSSSTERLMVDTSAAPQATSMPHGEEPKPTSTSTSQTAKPTASFKITEEVLDFSRTAVLYVLQEQTLDAAQTAQTSLQNFFTAASEGGSSTYTARAKNLSIGGDNSVNLDALTINIGSGPVGGDGMTRRAVSLKDAGSRMRHLRYRHTARSAWSQEAR